MNYIIRFKRGFPKNLKKEILERADIDLINKGYDIAGSEVLTARKEEIQNLAYETNCWIKIKRNTEKNFANSDQEIAEFFWWIIGRLDDIDYINSSGLMSTKKEIQGSGEEAIKKIDKLIKYFSSPTLHNTFRFRHEDFDTLRTLRRTVCFKVNSVYIDPDTPGKPHKTDAFASMLAEGMIEYCKYFGDHKYNNFNIYFTNPIIIKLVKSVTNVELRPGFYKKFKI